MPDLKNRPTESELLFTRLFLLTQMLAMMRNCHTQALLLGETIFTTQLGVTA